MISINNFNDEFIKRHDFIYDDLSFLSKKYPKIIFRNIPEAWVCEIDHTLSVITNPLSLRCISQIMGFLVLDGSFNETDKALIKELEQKIMSLDIDLYKDLDEGLVLN